MNVTDYIPHGLVTAFGTVVAFVARDHFKRDDQRFAEVKADYATISAKLDAQNKTTTDNHEEILRILGGLPRRGGQ
jgi:hypothetical protein